MDQLHSGTDSNAIDQAAQDFKFGQSFRYLHQGIATDEDIRAFHATYGNVYGTSETNRYFGKDIL